MKAFIFDMDGLMFDTERVFIGAWDYAGEKLGLGKAGFMVMKTLGSNTEACNQAWRDEFGAGDLSRGEEYYVALRSHACE